MQVAHGFEVINMLDGALHQSTNLILPFPYHQTPKHNALTNKPVHPLSLPNCFKCLSRNPKFTHYHLRQ
jgi:hypothetical protein